ncbi:PepSY domain-containing protein [Solwaraspora sp. WMMD1047]|uniref:PepSY-associated TM helix domain-containing protein n=1 Tax=Solwaraspora sp. WMMD1047 TaxID=3016102 RepID=UPI003242DF96
MGTAGVGRPRATDTFEEQQMTVTDVVEPQPSTIPARAPSRRPTGAFGALLLRLHFYAGVFVAPFIAVAALTGLIYSTAPQWDRAIHGEQLYVDAPAGATALPVADQVARAIDAHPEGTFTAVQPGQDGTTTRVVFSVPEMEGKQHTVYVDPYSGDVKGTLTTVFGGAPTSTWLGDLHSGLQLGDPGRLYSEFAASWLWVLALGGLVLWWRRRRSVKKMFAPELSAKKGVRRTRGWHGAVGVWLVVGMLILSATGLTWSQYAGANFGLALDALDGRTPVLPTAIDGAEPAPASGGHHGGGAEPGTEAPVDLAQADTVLTVARDNGFTGPIEISPPESAGSAWSVAGIDYRWPVDLDRIAVDPATSQVVSRSDFADWPLLAQLSSLGIQAHMGVLFGVVNQLLLAALAIGLICLIVWGYRMWWQRRPTRADRRALVGTAPARGGWIGLPAWAIVVGVPVIVALGWALPMFGIPLAVFLVTDVIVGAVQDQRRRSAPISPAPTGTTGRR